MKNKTNLPYYLIAALIIIVTLPTIAGIILTVMNYLKVFTIALPIKIVTYAQLLSASGSIILTLSLVLLYGQQTDIRRRQEKWMEAEHVPDVFVDSWFLDNELFEFKMTNLGTGIAKNLKVKYEIDIYDPNSSTELQTITGVAPLEQQDIFTRILPQASDTEQQSIQMQGNYNVRLQYKSRTDMFICSNNKVGANEVLRRVLQQIAGKVESIEFHICLQYDYIRRKEGVKKSVYGGCTEMKDVNDIDFEGLLLTAKETFETDLNIKPENLKET